MSKALGALAVPMRTAHDEVDDDDDNDNDDAIMMCRSYFGQQEAMELTLVSLMP